MYVQTYIHGLKGPNSSIKVKSRRKIKFICKWYKHMKICNVNHICIIKRLKIGFQVERSLKNTA